MTGSESPGADKFYPKCADLKCVIRKPISAIFEESQRVKEQRHSSETLNRHTW